MSPLIAWHAPCGHTTEGVYAGLAPVAPGEVGVATVCAGCRRLGLSSVAYPPPTFLGRVVGAG